MWSKNVIKLTKRGYLLWFGFPSVGLLFTVIGILIAYYFDFILGIVLLSFPIIHFGLMFFVRFFALRFLEINTQISKKDLFYIIDLLVALKDWEYGDIQDNEVTITRKNPSKNGQKDILKIIYFPETIMLNVINQPITFFNFSIKNNSKTEKFIEELILQKVDKQGVAANLKREITLEKRLGKQGLLDFDIKYNEDKGGCFKVVFIILFLAAPKVIASDFFKENSMMVVCFVVAFLVFFYLENWRIIKR